MVTEFVSSEGILRRDDRTRKYTEFDDAQRPVGVQIFGADAEAMLSLDVELLPRPAQGDGWARLWQS